MRKPKPSLKEATDALVAGIRSGKYDLMTVIHRDRERLIAETGLIQPLSDKENELLQLLIDVASAED